jgi:excisionase family DNA binding protein
MKKPKGPRATPEGARKPKQPAVAERRAYGVQEAADLYGVSRSFMWTQIRKGAVPVQRLGRRVLILDADLRAFFGEKGR